MKLQSRPALFSLRLLASRRFWVYLGITALWVTVMAQMGLHEAGRNGTSLKTMGISPEVLLVSWTDYEHWLWIEQAGQRSGAIMLSITPVLARTTEARIRGEAPGYQMQSRLLKTFSFGGMDIPAEIGWEVKTNSAFELETLDAALRMASQRLRVQAFAENRTLYYRVWFDSDPVSSGTQGAMAAGLLGQLPRRDLCGRSPLAEPIFMTDAVIPVLTRSQTLKQGERWVTRAGDPLGGVLGAAVHITVERQETTELGQHETVLAWRLTEQIGAMNSTVWYDLHGRMVKGELGNGMHLVRANASQVIDTYPVLKRGFVTSGKVDRDWIRRHLDPTLDGKPLSQLLPQVPGL